MPTFHPDFNCAWFFPRPFTPETSHVSGWGKACIHFAKPVGIVAMPTLCLQCSWHTYVLHQIKHPWKEMTGMYVSSMHLLKNGKSRTRSAGRCLQHTCTNVRSRKIAIFPSWTHLVQCTIPAMLNMCELTSVYLMKRGTSKRFEVNVIICYTVWVSSRASQLTTSWCPSW